MSNNVKLEFHIDEMKRCFAVEAECGKRISDYVEVCKEVTERYTVSWFLDREKKCQANLGSVIEGKHTELYGKINPYSSHTFVFPFLWNDSGKVSRAKFKKCFRAGWKEELTPQKVTATNKEFYDQYHYFNQAARNALYTSSFDKNAIVWNYRYDIESLGKREDHKGEWFHSEKNMDNPAKYIIKKDKKEIELNINGVRMKLFNTGIGMLIFELENYLYRDEETIIFINEFGRRVFMPYISDSSRACSLCADYIGVRFGDKTLDSASGKISGMSQDSENDIRLAEHIKFFLSTDNGYSICTSKEQVAAKRFFIEPIIDDRMFVACFYENKDFVDSVSAWDNGSYKYLSDAENMIPNGKQDGCLNSAARLYKMMFVDGDGLSCHSRTMLKKSLEDHIYDRWLEFGWNEDEEFVKSGSVTGITEYSMITVASYAPATSLPFLCEYVEMLILVLAQRASLLAFARIISEVSCNKIKRNVAKIQGDYVMFQSELLLQEVTPQQQGIELYNMLLDNLFITKEKSEVESQIKSLFEINTAINERKENWILFILTALGVSGTTQIFFGDWLNLTNEICLVISLVLIIGILVWKQCDRKR